ncbi:oligogalacturonate-specific porin KdgM family protein [Mixta intestinalis]|uniref:Oligogalacturonate-specific porin KdgM n=1 Tax=Mixta intestinalis TaxID=1615494 RepID=A0A6P1Q0F2_9GAMM|nr:oligogalacturonate-specific porin KdgM family protein [Mixta intestinalis]QHM71792.1 Oligogalacturonate-specific porin KdgM [Mixta intestinalis]
MKIKGDSVIIAGLALIISPSLLAADGKTILQYEHNFKTMDRRHSDSYKLIHKTKSLWQYEIKFASAAGGNKNYDVAWDDMQGGSGGIVVQKDFKFDDKKSTLTPSFEVSYGNSSVGYQPGVKYTYSINKKWSTYARYRYEIKKPSRSSRYKTISKSDKYGYAGEKYRAKSDTARHRIDTGISWNGIPNLSLGYVFNLYVGDNLNDSWTYKNGVFTSNRYSVYRDGKTDYEHQFKIQYSWQQWQPYLEIDDVSVSNTSKSRQGKFKIGVKYKFK